FFELSEVFESAPKQLPRQEKHLGLLSTSESSGEVGVSRVKGLISLALEQLGVNTSSITYEKNNQVAAPFDKQNTASILVDDNQIGNIGLIHRSARESMGLPDYSVIAEVNI